MASGVYNRFKYNCLVASGDLRTDVLKCALYSGDYTFSADNNVITDVTTQVVGTQYTAGGATMSGDSPTQDNGNDRAAFDANDTLWGNATFTARYAVVYNTTRSNSLICCIDFGSNQTVTNGTFTIQWNATGILTLS